MSNYPGTIDTFNVIGTTRYMDEAGYVLHEHLNTHGSAVNALETVLGTTGGTSVLKDFAAGEFAVSRNSGGTVTDTLTKGTANNFNLGTPTVVGGTFGTPAITGGTYTSPTLAGTPVLDANSAIPFYEDSMSRQAIMNGNFDVWQRGTSVALADATITYTADRWLDYHGDDGGTPPTLTRTRQTLTSGDIPNAFYYSRLTTNGSGSGLGTASVGVMGQRIEHGVRFLCGLNKKVTVSFWARSDIANKKLGIYIVQVYGTSGTPSTTEYLNGTNWTLTSTWTKYTYTFTTNTLVGKTLGTDNNDFIEIDFAYMWGTYPWADKVGATTAETYVGSGYIDIAQVQLCAGEVALPFQPKSFEQELQSCMRYYEKAYPYSVVPGTAAANGANRFLAGVNLGASCWTVVTQKFQVRKRTESPTVVVYDTAGTSGKISTVDQGTTETNNVTPTAVENKTDSGFVVAHLNTGEAGINFYWTADAEL